MNNAEKYKVICDLVEQNYPILAVPWQTAHSKFGDEWLNQFIQNVEVVFGNIKTDGNQIGLIGAIDGYAEFCNDSLRNQSYFEAHGRYKASKYSECVDKYYNNKDHMMRCYLPGMWISHFIWPQHYNMLVGFKSGILRRVQQTTNLFYEVGVGCGMYSKVVLESFPIAKGVGIDISQHSLDFTQQMVNMFGHGDRYHVERRDIRDGYTEKCDFLVCQEVLEHLENPHEFCGWLHNLIRPKGYAYITAAVNAAHSDHIYLFRNPLELEEILRGTGFTPLGLQEEFATGKKPRGITPSLAGYLCQRD